MNKIVSLIFILISLILFGYVAIGVYEIAPLLFQDKILIGQNISSLFALFSYLFLGINLLKDKYHGLPFSLSLTTFILAVSIAEQSRIFVLEMLKQLGLPFIIALLIFLVYRSNITGELIFKEASLAAVLWLGLRLLTFENIYNILISVTLFGIAYYILELVYPLSAEVNTNE